MPRYCVCAWSVTRPGTFLVRDEDGNCSVFFTNTGSLSVTTLDPALIDAIIGCDGWCRIEAETWLSLEELRHHVAGTVYTRTQAPLQPEA